MVRKTIHIILFVIQAGFSMLTLLLLYLSFALFDPGIAHKGLLSMFFIQPPRAMLFSGITVLICTLAGLYLRLNRTAFRWWTRHFYLALLLIFFGFVCILLSGSGSFADVYVQQTASGEVRREVPDAYMFLSGWFILTFGMMHLFPPYAMLEWITRIAERIRMFAAAWKNRH